MPEVATGVPGPVAVELSVYLVAVELVHDLRVRRWSVLNVVLALPHLVIVLVLRFVAFAVGIASFATIITKKQVPYRIFRFQVMVLRHRWRVMSYVSFLRHEYPAFEFSAQPIDSGQDPASLSVAKPDQYDLVSVFVQLLIAVRVMFVVISIGLFMLFPVLCIAALVISVTGRWPSGLRNLVVALYRFVFRANAFDELLVTAAPPLIFR